MKRTFTFLLFSVLMVVFVNQGFSQLKTTYTTSKKLKQPSFIVTFDFSYNLPMQQLKGEMGEQFSFKNYGTKFGTGAHINAIYVAGKKGDLRPYFTIGYDLFLNSDDNNAYLPYNTTYQWPSDTAAAVNPSGIPGKSKLYLHIFQVGLGFQYSFINKSKWTPYLNLDFDMNIFFGTYKQTPSGTLPYPYLETGEIPFTYKSASRFGLGTGFGVDGRVTQSFGVNIGVKYRIANLVAKDSKRTGEVNKFELNDKEDTNLSSSLNKDRNIGYLSFYLGAVFYVGKKK